MNYDYSETLNFTLKNKVGMIDNLRPLRPEGKYEALIYFVSPFWLCGKLKSPEDFLTGLVDMGKKLNCFENEEQIIQFIESRIKFYSTVVNNEALPIIVHYWFYTQPLSKLPDNENAFEFTSPSFFRELPPLSYLINEANKLNAL